MTTAEIVSLLRFSNGDVEQVAEILKSLDIKEPLAGPDRKRIKTGKTTATGLNGKKDPTPQDKRVVKILLQEYDTDDPQNVLIFKFKPTSIIPTLPSQIEFFTNLQELNCSYSKLTSLPVEIGLLSQLQMLDCFTNKLTSLPAEIGQLKQLKKLDCGNNQLTSLPAEIGLLNELKVLNCYANQLASLPVEIGLLTQLEMLDCSYNNLTSLPKEIGYLEKLKNLNCENNKIVFIPEEIARLKNLKILFQDRSKIPFFGSEEGRLVMEETQKEVNFQESVFDFMNEVKLEFFVLSLKGSDMFLIHFDKKATIEKSDYFKKIVNFIASGYELGFHWTTSVEIYMDMDREKDAHLLVLISLQNEVVLLNGFLLGDFSEKYMSLFEQRKYKEYNFPLEQIATISYLSTAKPPVNFSEYFFSDHGVYYFGTMLVRIFEFMAREADKKFLILQTVPTAVKFYEKLGFELISKEDRDLSLYYYKKTAVPFDSDAGVQSWHRVMEKRKEMEKALVLSQGNLLAAAQLVWYRLY